MHIGIFENVENKQKENTIEALIASSSPRPDFFFMVILSITMASIGILLDSLIVLLGSMLIAPVLYPVLGIAMGVAVFDEKLLLRSAYTLCQSIVVALLFSVGIGILFNGSITELDIITIIHTTPSMIMSLLVAIIAGCAASLSMIQPHMSESFPGVAVSVSLVPPLALAGIAASDLHIALVGDMILLFLINIVGIISASAFLFLSMKFSVKKKFTEKSVEADKEEVAEQMDI